MLMPECTLVSMFLPVHMCVRLLFICECVHACIVCIYQGGMGAATESMVQIKKKRGVCNGVMTRKRQWRVPKATCCSLVLARWRGLGGGLCLLVHLHTVCTGNSDYLDDSLACLELRSHALFTGPISPPLMPFIYSAGNVLRKCWIHTDKRTKPRRKETE